MQRDYTILNDFKARQMYDKAISYSAIDGHKDTKITGRGADNSNHRWREDVIKFINLKTEVVLTLYNYPKILNKNSLPEHSLYIIFFGEKIESSKRRLEQITGIGID